MNINSRQRCLVFYLATELHAIDISQVAEVREISQRSPIPGAPECLVGAINFHGNVTAVLDTAALFGIAGDMHYENEIVLTREIASLALLTGRILGIITPEKTDEPQADDENGTVVSCRILEGEVRMLNALDIAEMTESLIS